MATSAKEKAKKTVEEIGQEMVARYLLDAFEGKTPVASASATTPTGSTPHFGDRHPDIADAARLGAAAASEAGEQAVTIASRVRKWAERQLTKLGDAIDDWWIYPAIFIAFCYWSYCFLLLMDMLPVQVQVMRMQARNIPCASNRYYGTLALQLMIMAGVFVISVIAIVKGTRKDRLHPVWTALGVFIMLLNVPLSAILTADAISVVIHTALLEDVRLRFLLPLYATGSDLSLVGTIVANVYLALFNAIFLTSDQFFEWLTKGIGVKNLPFDKWGAYFFRVGMTLVAVFHAHYLLNAYFPLPQLAGDFLDYCLPLVVGAVCMLAAVDYKLDTATWRKVVWTFIGINTLTAIFVWYQNRHVGVIEAQIEPARGLLAIVWNWFENLSIVWGIPFAIGTFVLAHDGLKIASQSKYSWIKRICWGVVAFAGAYTFLAIVWGWVPIFSSTPSGTELAHRISRISLL